MLAWQPKLGKSRSRMARRPDRKLEKLKEKLMQLDR
jgi:hypothetical protein